MNYIYFGMTDGDLVDGYELQRIMRIVNGTDITNDDFDSVRKFAKTCKGIKGEVKRPSVKRLIENGHKVKAVKVYYNSHPSTSLKEAKEIVDSIEEKAKRLKEKSNEQRN